jgi:hypothetical protein
VANLPDDIVAACRGLQQGDIVADLPFVVLADLARPLGPAAKDAAAKIAGAGGTPGVAAVKLPFSHACILSQTCDLISPAGSRNTVVIAPVIAHENPADVEGKKQRALQAVIDEITAGRRVRNVHLDVPGSKAFPAGAFIDLYTVSTIEKSLLLGCKPIRPLMTADDRRSFAFRAAHVYDRPAIPAPFDDYVVKPLRDFLTKLKKDDPASFNIVQGAVEDEWLWLNDDDSPTVGTLYFVADKIPSKAAREILTEWWESIQNTFPGGYSLTSNTYASYRSISLERGRAMSLLTHWHLSDDPADAPDGS